MLSFDLHFRIATESYQNETLDLPSIILAEDNLGDVELLRLALEEHEVSCELLVAGDGEKAVSLLEEIASGAAACPRLVIIDLNLPKRNGREVLQYLRSCPAFAKVPAVILSSSGSPVDIAETTQLGATQYIRKPTNLEDFLHIGGALKLQLEGVNSGGSDVPRPVS